MKELRIEIPENHEIDKKLSTFELIKFKKIEKKLPESWNSLPNIKGAYVNGDACISTIMHGVASTDIHKNIFPTHKQAQATIALAQLLQLRDYYRDSWVPDWTNGRRSKYIIYLYENKWTLNTYAVTDHTFSFQSVKVRNEFFKNFKKLLEEVKPLFI